MSKNIYDLFNERKNGIDCLVEGYDFNIDKDAEFEDLDQAMEALDQITLESTNEMLEFRAAGYLEDLVLENMMFEDFDEERILHVMEAAKEEKKAGLGQKIKNLWEKIKQWFVGAFKAIANHFASGEQLVLKYKKEIPAAIAQAKGKVKMREPRKFEEAAANVQKKVENLRAKGKSKQDILDSIGVRDLKEIGGMVDSLYYISKEKKEIEIKSLNAQKLMDWAGNKKVYIDSLKKDQTETDKKFKEMLEEIKREGAGKEGDAAAKVAEDAANFQFGITALNKMLNAEIGVVKNISNMCASIIKKALGGNYDASKDPNKAGATEDDRRRQERFNKNKKVFGSKAAAQMSRDKLYDQGEGDGQGSMSGKTDAERAYDANKDYDNGEQGPKYYGDRKKKKDEKVNEGWEFIDDEYDNDDYEW